jgi:hypothetical protein
MKRILNDVLSLALWAFVIAAALALCSALPPQSHLDGPPPGTEADAESNDVPVRPIWGQVAR